jgi:molybdopterin molybdotransferase
MKVFGIVGWKNSGKTGLVERLVSEITARGLRVSTVKHAHHRVDVDQPGRDSHRHREAGAVEVMLASRNRWALMHELRGSDEPALDALLPKLTSVDLVLVEGFKKHTHPKIEAHRAVTDQALIAHGDSSIRAVASDSEPEGLLVPRFALDDTAKIADFLLAEIGLIPSKAPDKPLAPPKLKNDCFALPPGINWTPVDAALDRLRAGLSPVVETETLPLSDCSGRVLAVDTLARRSNPPAANSAVDGYGVFAATAGSDPIAMSLVDGRAAAGAPFGGTVPKGSAIRILTGAIIPEGVDAVVMEEDVTLGSGIISFEGPIKTGANVRDAGEDVVAGEVAVSAGTRMRPTELALLAAIGHGQAEVHCPLRVGVLSTGDEIVAPGSSDLTVKTHDANRPMLLSVANGWGYRAVDLGHVRDDREALRECLDQAASETDVILTSGGASAGDEDHLSAILKEEGQLENWRIALKPGRPLALGLWNGTPVFGLPGNPVAALVCTLIFARPALSVLAGGNWMQPQGFNVPAAFSKQKKPGRREYLRARIDGNGAAEVFVSEGSGRISGLSWAEGLVELPDGPLQVKPGTPVRFLPFSGLLAP